MNIVQEILQRHVSDDEILSEGKYTLVDVDFIYTNGLTLASAIKEINKITKKTIWDNQKIGVFPDHFTPNKDIPTANLKNEVRQWVKQNSIKNYFEVGDVGIEHIQFIEKQFVKPGSIVIGGDSHSCTLGALGILSLGVGTTDLAFGILTGKLWMKIPKVIKIELKGNFSSPMISGKDLILYILGKFNINDFNYKVLLFSGKGCKNLNLDDRISICNMSVEGGAKTALFIPEKNFLNDVGYFNFDEEILSCMNCAMDYDEKIKISLEEVGFQIACPDSPQNVKSLNDVKEEKVSLDQVFLGSCTNGSLEDLRSFASIIKGKRRNSATRVIVIPATPQIYKDALKEGIIESLLEFGAVIGPPTCGPCLGGHMGVIGDNEVCLATTNRNFKGRMGSTKSKIYLSSPVIAAYSAIAGYITGPEE